MPRYRCLIEGENFPLAVDGGAGLVGFFTTRWVEAASVGEAERKAVELIRGDNAFANMPRADVTPMIYVRDIAELPASEPDAPGSGFTFFPMNT